MKVSGILVSVYLLAILWLASPPIEHMALATVVAVLSIISSIREARTLASIMVIALAALCIYAYSLTNIYSLTTFLAGVLIFLPAMVAVSRIHTHSPDIGGIRSDSSKKRLIVPFAYVGAIIGLSLVFVQNELYSLYFYASGHTMLQIYLLIGLSVIVFLPLYEYLDH